MLRLQTIRTWVLAGFSVVLLATMVSAIYTRGPWYDEFYTSYVSRPGPGLSVLWPAWLRDSHPPLYYFLAWVTNFLGDSFPQRRLVNLAFLLIGSVAIFLLCRARPASRLLVVPYGIALASYLPAIDRVSELRSYFLTYITTAVAVAALAELARPHQPPRSLRSLIFLTVALAVSFSVHLAASVIMGAVSAAFGLRLLLMRDWRGSKELALVGGIAAAPFICTTAMQVGDFANNTAHFWVPGGFNAARWTIEKEITADFTSNWPLTAFGIAGFVILGVKVIRERRLSDWASLVITLGAGLLLAIIALLVIHLQRPFVVDRYLIGLHAPVAMMLATGVAAFAEAVGASIAVVADIAMVFGALFAIHAHFKRAVARPSWYGTGAVVERIVADCPGTIVYISLVWDPGALKVPPIENSAVNPYAYTWVARHYGFKFAPLNSRAIAKGCPTLFWAENAPGTTAEKVYNKLRQLGFPIQKGYFDKIGDGWIYIVPPPETTGQPNKTTSRYLTHEAVRG